MEIILNNERVILKMKNTAKKRSGKLIVARNLPPLFHKLPECEYSPKNSQVIKWLIERPSILDFIWDQIKQSGDVFYNHETGKWQGVDYEPDN